MAASCARLFLPSRPPPITFRSLTTVPLGNTCSSSTTTVRTPALSSAALAFSALSTLPDVVPMKTTS